MSTKTPSAEVAAVQSITAANGFTYTPSVVTDKPTKAVRGVQVVSSGGKASVTINAEGKCLESLKASIRSKLGDKVQFTDEVKSQPKEGKSDANS